MKENSPTVLLSCVDVSDAQAGWSCDFEVKQFSAWDEPWHAAIAALSSTTSLIEVKSIAIIFFSLISVWDNITAHSP